MQRDVALHKPQVKSYLLSTSSRYLRATFCSTRSRQREPRRYLPGGPFVNADPGFEWLPLLSLGWLVMQDPNAPVRDISLHKSRARTIRTFLRGSPSCSDQQRGFEA